jgi:hypothetical protein
MSFTKYDIITTDKYLNSFNDIYYKTDVIFYNKPIIWRNKVINTPQKNMKVLISGHSDYPIIDNYVDYYSPKYWYTVNKQTKKQNVFSLPLGITNHTNESLMHQVYGNQDCMISVMNEDIEKKKLIYMNFNISTFPNERQYVYNLFCNKDYVTIGKIVNTINGRTNFLREIKSHYFILCPRGNGVDTHRLWEALYMGSIPIVIKDIAFNGFEDLPICFIDKWSDINEDFLEKEKNRILNTNYCLDKLKISYWIEKIQNCINLN